MSVAEVASKKFAFSNDQMNHLGLDERTSRRLSKAINIAVEAKREDKGKRKLSSKTQSAIGAVAKICEINHIGMTFEGDYPVLNKHHLNIHCVIR